MPDLSGASVGGTSSENKFSVIVCGTARARATALFIFSFLNFSHSYYMSLILLRVHVIWQNYK